MDMHQHILTIAADLFYHKGIRAVGVDEIIAAAKVAKATLYRHFPSKERLIEAYLVQRSTYARARLDESATLSSDAKQQIVDAFGALDQNLSSPNFRGCAFLLAVSEHGDLASVREISEQHKLYVRNHFAKLASKAGLADHYADQLALIYEGALATIVVRPNAAPGETAIALVKTLIGHDTSR